MQAKTFVPAAVTALLGSCLWLALAEPGKSQANSFKTSLSGYQEVPAVFTAGHGTLRLTISDDETKILYELTYDDLNFAPSAAHVHFGLPATNGAVLFSLCGTPVACPPNGQKISGTVVAADIKGADPINGILAGEMAKAIRAIRDGATYVNVHTTRFPGGEIRGHIGTPPNSAPVLDTDDEDDDNPGKGNSKGQE